MKKGFTLIELSIVLVIVGLLIGGSIQATTAMRDRSKVIETQHTFEALKERLYGFALNTNTLPATQAQFDVLTGTPRDAWGNPILYRPDAALAIDPCSPVLSTSTTTGDFVQGDIAFILLSSGKEYNVAQTVLGLNTPLFNQGDHDTNPATLEYDDRFLVITRAQLQSNINCQQNELQILNSRLPIATQGVLYLGIIASSGGNGIYTYTYNGAPTTIINGVTFINNTFNGIPTTAGAWTVDIGVASAGQARTRRFVLTVDTP